MDTQEKQTPRIIVPGEPAQAAATAPPGEIVAADRHPAQDNRVRVRKGTVEFRGHLWWARYGLIHWREQATGKTGSQTVRDTLERMSSLSEMVGRSIRSPSIAAYADELRAYQDYLDGMVGLCRMARDQGDPDDPRHQAQMKRDKIRRW